MGLRRLVVGFVISFVIAPLAIPQKAPRIQVTTEEVTINVRFTDRFNRGITDIQPSEIRILEDGVEQKLARFFRSEEPFDVALLLDMSPSTTENQEGIRDRSAGFVAQMPEGNRLLLVTFENKIFIDCDWTPDLQKVLDTVENLAWNEKASSTHLYEAVSLVAQKKFKRSTPRKAMIVYTDGIDMGSDDFSKDDSLEIIEESGILVYPIQFDSRQWWVKTHGPAPRSPTDPDYRRYPDDRYPRNRRPKYDPQGRPYPPDSYPPDDDAPDPIPDPTPPVSGPGGIILGRGGIPSGRQVARAEAESMYRNGTAYLRQLATVSSGKYFETPNINALENAYGRIIQELSDLYTITYVPSPRKTDGQLHRIKVDVTRPDVAVQTTKGGYMAKKQ